MAEAVTLAHVARPALLARYLDASRYDITFASAPRYLPLLGDFPFPFRRIESIPEEQFLDALAHGRPLHDARELRSYVEEDLSLLKEVRPALVVGDLRHSLAVSARLAGVPYASIVNAYWSPYAKQRFCVPEVPATRILGVPLADALFRCVRPLSFAAHCRPMNRVLREHGMSPVGRDIRKLYTDADWVLYPDVPDLVPAAGLPPSHRYLGPLLWSPVVEHPAWWTKLPADRPLVYLTLGSSGPGRLLSACLESLAGERVAVMVAGVARERLPIPANAFFADFLPGVEAAARSSLVICNGGSPTAYQALAAGVPVLGLPSNMDHHTSMSYIAAAGAGESLRSEYVTAVSVRAAARRLLTEPSFRDSALRISRSFAAYDAASRFRSFVAEVCGTIRHENGG